MQRWINYYGPKNTFSSVNLAQALDPEGVPPGFFKDKIVMIGGRSAVGYLAAGRDEFGTPYSRGTHQFTPGLEVHANILLNLLRGEWLTRIPEQVGNGHSHRRWFDRRCARSFASLPRGRLGVDHLRSRSRASAFWFVWHRHVWFDWMVPAAIQMPLGLVWSVGSQYLLESRRRKELRRAFGFYLSPQMADKIADSDFDLKPGGKVVDVTVIFTDLESFTSISENLDPSGGIGDSHLLLWTNNEMHSREQGDHHQVHRRRRLRRLGRADR